MIVAACTTIQTQSFLFLASSLCVATTRASIPCVQDKPPSTGDANGADGADTASSN